MMFQEWGLTSHVSGCIVYGILLGSIESTVITPFDAIKISMQAQRISSTLDGKGANLKSVL